MPEPIIPSPGTVSKILWHFTGGPNWNAAENKQNKEPKPATQAYKNLKAILSSRELRIGQYKEVVKVMIPERRKYDSATRKYVIEKNVLVELASAPVCCLADIPIAHLSYHAYRYGKFTIGFHRDPLLRNGFNPVLYTLQNTRIIRSIYNGISQLEFVDTDSISSAASDIDDEVSSSGADDLDVSSLIYGIESEASSIDDYVSSARGSFGKLLAFIKTFDEDEFSTIYCEREWRSTKTYSFSFEDIAMIVLPKKVGGRKYFSEFVSKDADKIDLPRSIPVVPWEDLVEH